MSMIYTGTKSVKKQNKKVGWKQKEEQYKEWLSKHSPNAAEVSKLKYAKKRVEELERKKQDSKKVEQREVVRPAYIPDMKEVIHDPRVLYKDQPEMLERELKARERKFMTAPVYNKGPDVLISNEMLKDIISGATRRRN